MSPEQASGRPVDFRSDQFSFGSVAYDLATGKKPFQRNTAAETLTAIIREEPEPVAALSPQTPALFAGSSSAAWRRTPKADSTAPMTWPVTWREFPSTSRR
jgi:serine/threonine protein kinase